MRGRSAKAPLFSGLLTRLVQLTADSKDLSSHQWKNKAHLAYLPQSTVCFSNHREGADSKNSLCVGYINLTGKEN